MSWAGRRDLSRFVRLAQAHGLYINLRIGPYVCGEYYFGGIPLWLRGVDDVQCFRCSDKIWEREMAKIVGEVVDEVRPLLAQHGGPIILLQVENEYNGASQKYLEWAVDMANNLTAKEGAIWSLCHDHSMCTEANAGGHSALCTINGFWMDE